VYSYFLWRVDGHQRIELCQWDSVHASRLARAQLHNSHGCKHTFVCLLRRIAFLSLPLPCFLTPTPLADTGLGFRPGSFVAIAFAPMFVAPLSETLGRRPLFVISVSCMPHLSRKTRSFNLVVTRQTFMNFICYLPQALAPNIAVIYVFRVCIQYISAHDGSKLGLA
jgi:MFS family permease